MQGVSAHPVLKTLPATAELVRKYNYVSNTLNNYETEMVNAWMNHNVRFSHILVLNARSSLASITTTRGRIHS